MNVSCLDAILQDGALKAKANFGFRRWGRDLWWSRVWTPSFKMARYKQKLNSKFASLPLLSSWDCRSIFQRGRGARGEGLGLPSLKSSKPPSPVVLGLQKHLSAWKGSARGGVRPPLAQAWQVRFEKLILKSAPKVPPD